MATTITVESETLERFNRLKENTGDDDIPELSSDQFMKSLLDTWEENGESIYGEQPEAKAIAQELKESMDILTPEQAERITEQGDDRAVLNRLDDLQTHIDSRFNEVQR